MTLGRASNSWIGAPSPTSPVKVGLRIHPMGCWDLGQGLSRRAQKVPSGRGRARSKAEQDVTLAGFTQRGTLGPQITRKEAPCGLSPGSRQGWVGTVSPEATCCGLGLFICLADPGWKPSCCACFVVGLLASGSGVSSVKWVVALLPTQGPRVEVQSLADRAAVL